MVECHASDLIVWVRFPLAAPMNDYVYLYAMKKYINEKES